MERREGIEPIVLSLEDCSSTIELTPQASDLQGVRPLGPLFDERITAEAVFISAMPQLYTIPQQNGIEMSKPDTPGDAFLRVLSDSMIPQDMFDTIWQNVSEAGIEVVWRDDIDAALQTLIRWCEGGYADAVAEAMDMQAARKGLERVCRELSR